MLRNGSCNEGAAFRQRTQTQLLQNMLKIPFNVALFSRGVSLESCIVVQHVGGDSKNGCASPVSKKPCPDLKVCPYLIFFESSSSDSETQTAFLTMKVFYSNYCCIEYVLQVKIS